MLATITVLALAVLAGIPLVASWAFLMPALKIASTTFVILTVLTLPKVLKSLVSHEKIPESYVVKEITHHEIKTEIKIQTTEKTIENPETKKLLREVGARQA